MKRLELGGSYLAEEPARPPAGNGGLRHRWARAWRRQLVVLTLVLTDVLLAFAVWVGASALYDAWVGKSLSDIAVASIAPNVAVWIGLRALLGLYPGYGLDQVEELRRQSYAVAATLAITATFLLALKVTEEFSRLALVLGFLGLALLAPLVRPLVKRGMRQFGIWGKPVVVLGAGKVAEYVVRALRREWQLGLRPVAVFDDRPVPGEEPPEGVPYGTVVAAAEEVAREHGADTVILATPQAHGAQLSNLVDWISSCFRYVVVVPDLGGLTHSAVVARDLAGTFGAEIKQNLLNRWARRTKRALDLSVAAVGGLLVLPLVLVAIPLIKLDSPGPVFYGQPRPGARGNRFRCWKFRTMVVDAERRLDESLQRDPDLRIEWERGYKLKDDPRVTRAGRFLRKTSLDELPQLWNVLRGEMSLVGPRPILLAELPRKRGKAYDGKVYELYKRVPPGITGLWQVSGRSNTTYEERVAMDAYYVRNWSVWLDLVILARTVTSVILGRGAR